MPKVEGSEQLLEHSRGLNTAEACCSPAETAGAVLVAPFHFRVTSSRPEVMVPRAMTCTAHLWVLVVQAGRYQMMIVFLISGSTGIAAMAAVHMAVRTHCLAALHGQLIVLAALDVLMENERVLAEMPSSTLLASSCIPAIMPVFLHFPWESIALTASMAYNAKAAMPRASTGGFGHKKPMLLAKPLCLNHPLVSRTHDPGLKLRLCDAFGKVCRKQWFERHVYHKQAAYVSKALLTEARSVCVLAAPCRCGTSLMRVPTTDLTGSWRAGT